MIDYPFSSALVTGASSGIGAAMAELLGRAGVPTVVVARRTDRLEALAQRVPNLEVITADLTDGRQLGRIERRVGSVKEPVDLVVNNAGFGTSGWFHEQDPARMTREITLNVTAVTRLSRSALGAMRERGRGYLLNVSSVVSFQAGPKLAVYAATKAYVTSLTEALHEEARGSGVHVTALCPGLTETEFSEVSGGTSRLADKAPGFARQSAHDVARVGLADVAAGKALSVPGLVNKSMVASADFVPRALVRRVVGLSQLGRVRGRNAAQNGA